MKIRTIFPVVLVLMLLTAGCEKKRAERAETPVAVHTAKLARAHFEESASTQAVIEASEQAVLSALTAARLEKINVREGERFVRDQELFRSDREYLENRRTLAFEGLKMAQQRVRTRQADLELARVSFEKARLDYERSRTLYGTQSVSQDNYESMKLKYDAGLLQIRQAEAALATAEAEVSFAQATLDIAERRLSDAVVKAPYDGIVTARLREENEYCNAGTPVLKVESRGTHRIKASLSAVHYNRFKVGKTLAAVSFAGRELARVPVTLVDGAVDPLSRTFEVKADLPLDFPLPSGTLCDVRFIFDSRDSWSLPEEALLFGADGSFSAFAVENGRAVGVRVRTGLTAGGRTELLDAEPLVPRDWIVSGHYFVSDGTPVRIVQESRK